MKMFPENVHQNAVPVLLRDPQVYAFDSCVGGHPCLPVTNREDHLTTGIGMQGADSAVRQREPAGGLTDSSANDYQILPEIVT